MLSGLNLAFVSESLDFAPALDVKIDAAPFQKFDPLSQTRYFLAPALDVKIDAAYRRHLLRSLSDVERSKSSVIYRFQNRVP